MLQSQCEEFELVILVLYTKCTDPHRSVHNISIFATPHSRFQNPCIHTLPRCGGESWPHLAQHKEQPLAERIQRTTMTWLLGSIVSGSVETSSDYKFT